MGISSSDRAALIDARDKARKLLAGLEAQRAELEKKWPALEDAKLIAGREAFEKAIASSQRMLDSLEKAIALADKMN